MSLRMKNEEAPKVVQEVEEKVQELQETKVREVQEAEVQEIKGTLTFQQETFAEVQKIQNEI